MKRVFLDTNILLDFGLGREEASEILIIVGTPPVLGMAGKQKSWD